MKNPVTPSAVALAICLSVVALVEPPQSKWGDQSNGVYVNPVLPADFSDLDAIRVGPDFYAISSTFQYSPGMVVLHSQDLVNWKILGHVVPDLTRISPQLNWDQMNRSGRGIWAGSIRYHNGLYWVYFGTPDEGLFMSQAGNPAGPWTPVKRILAQAGWDDPCPFWDDDAQGYLVATHFQIDPANGKSYNIHLFQMTPDGERLIAGADRIIHQSNGSEANKLYKINGLYYHFYSELKAEGRVAMMGRARSMAGPWETRQLIHVDPHIDKEPNQGGLVQLASRDWYFFSHQGTGDWEGRAAVLLPVTWINGWPILGKPGLDGIGNMVWRGLKPIPGFPVTTVAASDDFNQPLLQPEWEWNYQPRNSKWSLAQRPGFLRLHSFPPLRSGDFKTVGNVLTQRALRARTSEVTVKLRLTGMVVGQEAGIAHFAKTFSTLTVLRNGAGLVLKFVDNGRQTLGPPVPQKEVWLRSTWTFDGWSHYAYSLDGTAFHPFGAPYRLSWGFYRGDHIGIFTFNKAKDDGYVDVDWFHYRVER